MSQTIHSAYDPVRNVAGKAAVEQRQQAAKRADRRAAMATRRSI